MDWVASVIQDVVLPHQQGVQGRGSLDCACQTQLGVKGTSSSQHLQLGAPSETWRHMSAKGAGHLLPEGSANTCQARDMGMSLECSSFHSISATGCRVLACNIPVAPSRRELSVNSMFQAPASFPFPRTGAMVSQPRGWHQAPGHSHDSGLLQAGSSPQHRPGTQQPHSPPSQR